MIKKIFLALIAVCLTALALFTASVHAADVTYLSVFGDSIPAGYGLSIPDHNFVSLLVDEYNLTFDTDAYNFSVSGATSTEILGQIKNTGYEILQNSDTIVISAGGNDILNAYGNSLIASAGKYQSEMENAGIRLNYQNPVNMLSQVTSLFFDPDKAQIILKIFDDAISDEAQAKYNHTVAKFRENINEMVSYIRNTGSKANIYFLTLYNPISVFAIDVDFFNHLDQSIETMQKDVLTLAESDSQTYAVDVLDDFKGHYSDWTRIYDFDIHPNKNGHQRLYTLVSNAIKGIDTPKEQISEQISEIYGISDISVQSSIQEEIPENNDYIIWIIIGGMVLLAVIIAAVIAITKNSD